MRIAVFEEKHGWPAAARALGLQCILLPRLPNSLTFEATLEDRIQHGRRVFGVLSEQRADFILDSHGDGMLFVDDPKAKGLSALLHHALGVPLVSHWRETLRIYFKKMPGDLLHEALRSPSWHKGVFTKGHLREMQWMGIPGCFYLPWAVDDFGYSTAAPAVEREGPKVWFAGSQQSLYFAHPDGVDTRTQQAGAIAVASVTDDSAATYLDAYQSYALGRCPAEAATAGERADSVRTYYDQKMFYSAWRNLAFRDRFILFLKKKMGNDFLLVGHDRWKNIYGLEPHLRAESGAFTELNRRTPICLNMPNGDNETGLNLRPFEITAAGGFLLSYYTPELGELFEIGRECEAFSSERELTEKIDFYLAHPDQRDAVARAGQARTLRDHLLQHRLETMLDHLRQKGDASAFESRNRPRTAEVALR